MWCGILQTSVCHQIVIKMFYFNVVIVIMLIGFIQVAVTSHFAHCHIALTGSNEVNSDFFCALRSIVVILFITNISFAITPFEIF